MRGERESEGRGRPVEGAERDLSKIWMRSVPPQAKQGQARQHASGRLCPCPRRVRLCLCLVLRVRRLVSLCLLTPGTTRQLLC